jgi:hypothetical protein
LIVTRIVLQNIEAASYGFWLAALQVANYANILDLGALAILPRNVAVLNEISDPADRQKALEDLLAQCTRTVILQTSVLLALGLIAILGMHALNQMPSPLLIVFVLIVFLIRPGRIPGAVLDGLLEFATLGKILLLIPLVTSVTTILMVTLGFGLLGVLTGWVLGQIVSTVAAYLALRRIEPALAIAILQAPLGGPWTLPWRTGWMLSLQQITQTLTDGSEVVFIGALLGPAYVPAYLCTTKAGILLASLPMMVMNVFLPTLASIRASRSDTDLTRVIQALAFVMATVAGVIALGTIGLNELFVGLWVGPQFYLGDSLTIAVAIAVFVRQCSLVLATSAFAWGEEVSTARAAVLESLLFGLLASVGMIMFGVLAIPVAKIIAILTVRMPLDAIAIGRRVSSVLGPVLGTLLRRVFFLLLSMGVLYAGRWLAKGYSPLWIPFTVAVALLCYLLTELACFHHEGLARYLPSWLQAILLRFLPKIA